MNVLIKARDEIGFHRCGVFFPHKGRIFTSDDFTDKQWERLQNEPMLHLSETKEAPTDGAMLAEDPNAGLKGLMVAEINDFTTGDFQKDGKPKLDALRIALPDHKAQIDAPLRDAVWEGMTEGGFAAPKAAET